MPTWQRHEVCDQEVVDGRSQSRCAPRCGDGVVVGDEICDDGDANGTRDYCGCTRDCQLGSYCGDGVVDEANEECDDGARNVFVYDEPGGCTPDCKVTPFCGDRVVDLQFDEDCDDGTGHGNPVGICASCQWWTGP